MSSSRFYSVEQFLATDSERLIKSSIAKTVVLKGIGAMFTHLLNIVDPGLFETPRRFQWWGGAFLYEYLEPSHLVYEVGRMGIVLLVNRVLRRVGLDNKCGALPSVGHTQIAQEASFPYQLLIPTVLRPYLFSVAFENDSIKRYTAELSNSRSSVFGTAITYAVQQTLFGVLVRTIERVKGHTPMSAKMITSTAVTTMVLRAALCSLSELIGACVYRRFGANVATSLCHISLDAIAELAVQSCTKLISFQFIERRATALFAEFGDKICTPPPQFSPANTAEFHEMSANTFCSAEQVMVTCARSPSIPQSDRVYWLRQLAKSQSYMYHVREGRLNRPTPKPGQERPYAVTEVVLTKELYDSVYVDPGAHVEFQGQCIQCRQRQDPEKDIGVKTVLKVKGGCNHFFCSQECLDQYPKDWICICFQMIQENPGQDVLDQDHKQLIKYCTAMDKQARAQMLIPRSLHGRSWQSACYYAVQHGLVDARHYPQVVWETVPGTTYPQGSLSWVWGPLVQLVVLPFAPSDAASLEVNCGWM